jgi:hypothetical protein
MPTIDELLDDLSREALAAAVAPTTDDSPSLDADEYGPGEDEDMPGGCIYCWGSGVIEDFEGDRDCSGCDGTGTPVERTSRLGRLSGASAATSS